MSHNLKVQAVAVVVLLLSLSAAALVMRPIAEERQNLKLDAATGADASGVIPPRVAWSMATLGPFRSLAIDYLWYRANALQQDGQFFEAYQLSQWITSLQPRAAHVWGFHAWNMAYNISVATYTPQERWDWVNKGISLLRENGIPLNPGASRLYRELGWIFFHKIGRFTDDMNWHYKRMLALQWQELLGKTHEGTTTEEVIDNFRAIAEAPDSIEQLLVEQPEVESLLEELYELGYKPGEAMLRQVGKVLMYTRSDDAKLGVVTEGSVTDYDPGVYGLMKDPRYRRQMKSLLPYLRKKILRESYRMDPGFMLELMGVYGPMDWRHAASHGAYWSELGVRSAGQWVIDPRGLDLLNTNRQAIHSLQQLAWFGKISFDPISLRIDLLPDPRFIPAYDRAMDLARERIEAGEYREGAVETFEKGHENFLLRAVTDHYLYGNQSEAEAYYKKVRRLYAAKPWNAASGRYARTVEELVVKELKTHLDLFSNARQFITAMLGRAFDHGLAMGQMNVFNRYVALAKRGHEEFEKDKTTRGYTGEARVGLLPFHQTLVETYAAYMQSPSLSLMKRSRTWINTPIQLRQTVYDRVIPVLYEQAQQARVNVDAAFPEPPGMESVRDVMPRPEPQETDSLRTTIEQQ